MTKKKPTKKKREVRVLAEIEMSPGVEEILESAEAKLYLSGIHRSVVKLSNMISRELGKK